MKINILGLGITALLIFFVTTVFAEEIQLLETPQNSNSIRSIDISNIQNGEVVAKLTLDHPLQTLPMGVSLSNPFRIYFFYHAWVSAAGEFRGFGIDPKTIADLGLTPTPKIVDFWVDGGYAKGLVESLGFRVPATTRQGPAIRSPHVEPEPHPG